MDNLRRSEKAKRIGDYIELVDTRNEELEYGLDSVRGVSIEKKFIDTKADMSGVNLSPYYVVKPNEFAYVTVTSRNGEKISLAINDSKETYICSSSYVVFRSIEFDERLRQVVDAYNSRDKLVFTSEVVADFVNDLSDQLIKIMNDLKADQTSFERLGISYEEKAFYDILVKVRDDHGFPYADEKSLILAKKIKELVDDKAQFADWSTRDDIKNQLNMDLTVLLYQNGYPPEWDEEVFEKVMEQAENFKR